MLWATFATDVNQVAQDSPILLYGGLAALLIKALGDLFAGTGQLIDSVVPILEAIRQRWKR